MAGFPQKRESSELSQKHIFDEPITSYQTWICGNHKVYPGRGDRMRSACSLI
jgi:hypothetical protein